MADTIFAVRQRMEKQGRRTTECLVKKSGGAIGRRDCQKNYVMIAQDMYEGAITRAKTNVDYMGSEEITISGGNEGVKMDERSYQTGQNKE